MTIGGSGGKWLIGGAIVSLCLNLFLVGLLAGHWIYGPHPGARGASSRGGGPEAMIMGVPPDLRPLIKEKFDAARPQFQAARDQVRAARDKVAAAASADPFDPAAFDQAFTGLQQAMDGVQKIAHETISAILPQIPAKERKDLVDKWAKRWGGHGDAPPAP
ncbi:MAG TPA: periplasmic heavy metal sensor [Dongiaceae bacterium]|jgi:uncharacterized membrane protein